MEKKITNIEKQKRNTKRVNIHLDGEYAFSLSKYSAAWLKTGQTISEEKIVIFKDVNEKEEALNKALRFISFKPRTRYEVEKKLNTCGVTESTTAYVIERLSANEIIDDVRFAQNWVDSRLESKARSHWLIEKELRAKHVPEDAIRKAMQDVQSDLVSAKKAASLYARRLYKEDYQTFRRRMAGFLQRRGFTWEITAQVIREIWEKLTKSKETK